jgi:hypothetical protein
MTPLAQPHAVFGEKVEYQLVVMPFSQRPPPELDDLVDGSSSSRLAVYHRFDYWSSMHHPSP